VISGQIIGSRKGVIWSKGFYGDTLYKIGLGATAEAVPYQEPPPKEQGWFIYPGQEIYPSHFAPYDSHGNRMPAFGLVAIDDVADRFIDIGWGGFKVYQFSTGKLIYRLNAFGWEDLAAVCLEDLDHIYLLGVSGRVILYDYARGEVLGVANMPPRPDGSTNYQSLNTVITWDPVYRRLLVADHVPDVPPGKSTSRIRGFRLVPEPVRITKPIPLKVPRQRRIVPVLVQVVGDANEGVGGYLVNATVTGSGSLAGIPITNHWGECKLPVATEGHVTFTGRSDWATTGSPEATPPHAGLVTINAWVEWPDIDAKDLPVTGTSTPRPRDPGAPGAPGEDVRHRWDWNPLGGPDPDAPGTQDGAPTTMAEWEAYFFGLIHRVKDTPANDWEDVLNGLKDQGMRINVKANEVPQTTWPFYGINLVLAPDVPTGKIQLPTATPDSSNKYMHEVWVIKVDDTEPGTTAEAPNMKYILDQVFARQHWNLLEANQYAPDGRGAFTEAVVTALHDVDARWGHVDKADGTGPSPNRYNGHAVDAINFKNDDGITAEIYDIVSGATGDYGWGFSSRGTDELTKWKYPA
jgi:hypothetical protein